MLASVEVEAENIGRTCLGRLESDNNGSSHAGNNLIVSSGGTVVTAEDFELEPFEIIILEGEIVLGDTVVVEIFFGEDGITSAGFTLTFDCTIPQPTTTTTSTSTTTVVPPSSSVAPSTTTSIAPPTTSIAPPTTSIAPPTSTTLPSATPGSSTPGQPSFTG